MGNISFVLLAAGRSSLISQKQIELPKCIIKYNNNKTILDNIISITKELNINKFNLVGGYKILDIMNLYPTLNYFYNEAWDSTNTLYSLKKIIDFVEEDILISYSDTLYDKNIIKALIKNRNSISIAYDSLWKQRYEGKDISNSEKIYIKNNSFLFSKKILENEILGEFTGLIYIPKKYLKNLKQNMEEELKLNKNLSIFDFLNKFTINKIIEFIDVKANWAELDSIQDVENFIFGTKAETLKNLENKVERSRILKQYSFKVKEFLENKNSIIKNIQNLFSNNYLAIRSSALNEDTQNSSMAGNYLSVLKVEKNNSKILKNAILKVVSSYIKNAQSQNLNNQVLVQPYLENVTKSGVAFTKNLQTNSPYYTINYAENSNTESITSGYEKVSKTFIYYRNSKENIEDKDLCKLVIAIKEIENITKYDAIDIEFAFIKDELFILQARPIAAKKNSLLVLESKIDDEIKNIKEFISNSKDNDINLIGESNAYGVMPDWNPAEIIGINPKKLAFDLYKFIITDNIWAKSRRELGYRDVKNANGLVSFAGKPYVDIKMSFNTFIPNNIDENLASKMCNYFIEKLKQNPFQHDKVEFSIVLTSYDFNFDEKMHELKENNFTKSEINIIKDSYKNLTQNIVNEEIVSIKNELNLANMLNKRREYILNSSLSIPAKIYNLLEDTKNYGTLSFSKLARCGFIGSIFLKSLLEKNLISHYDYNEFLKSINTITKSFIKDLSKLKQNSLSKSKFIEKYGHLRPGTYDITSLSYKENFNNYIQQSKKTLANKEIKINKNSIAQIKSSISKELEIHSLNFNSETLINFIIKATEARELSKFQFTKNLSAILDLILQFASSLKISREDIANIDLNAILELVNSSNYLGIKERFEKKINNNKEKNLLTNALQLPDLIFSSKDIDMFFHSPLKPNFISQNSIIAQITVLKNNSNLCLKDKIVFIENADPGFDWIFSHNIKGLVTKYGGAASHMAIRCAEFDLPAAIGCGEKIYNSLLKVDTIILDCSNKIIRSL